MSQRPIYKSHSNSIAYENQIKQIQRQRIWQQFQRNNQKRNSRQSNQNKGLQKTHQRTYSLKNMNNPEMQNANNTIQRNNKQEQIRFMLAQDLKRQIQEKQQKKRKMMNRKVQQEKNANQQIRQILDKEAYSKKLIKQMIQKQIAEDYQERIKRSKDKNQVQLRQKQKIKQKLKAIQQQFNNKYEKPKITDENPMNIITAELSKSSKSPIYYNQVNNYQMENYHNYEENVKNSLDNQNKKMDDIVEERIRQNKRKYQQYEKNRMIQRQMQKQELQRVLSQQIKQSERKKLQQKNYDKSKFYIERSDKIYYPNGNTIESKNSREYIYHPNQPNLHQQRRNSRQNISTFNPVEGQIESSLARKGSRSLL